MLPLENQCRFWAGFIRKSRIPLKCLVYSGNKSIHGCIDIRAGDANKYAEDKRKIESLFAASLNPALCADTAAMRPRTGMRLAGVIRRDSGKEQTLLWACNLDGNSPQTRQNAPSAPYGASGRVGCAVDAPKQETCPAGFLAHPAMDGENVRYRCAECRHVDKCKAGFRRFWAEKSRNGVGCTYCAWETDE